MAIIYVVNLSFNASKKKTEKIAFEFSAVVNLNTIAINKFIVFQLGGCGSVDNSHLLVLKDKGLNSKNEEDALSCAHTLQECS